jgi:hypothetical protein
MVVYGEQLCLISIIFSKAILEPNFSHQDCFQLDCFPLRQL